MIHVYPIQFPAKYELQLKDNTVSCLNLVQSYVNMDLKL